jgi:hypothetical protein
MSEIEEMISTEEARHQTEIEFGMDTDGRLLKLNVADGTFDPERRRRMEEGLDDEASDHDSEEESDDRLSGALILRKGEDNPEPTEAAETDAAPEQPEPAVSGAGESS